MDGGLAAELNVDSWRRCRSRWRSCGMMTAQVKHLATLVAGMPEMQTAWWLVVFPGIVIMAIVLCINFIGDGLRDALDPTQRRVRA